MSLGSMNCFDRLRNVAVHPNLDLYAAEHWLLPQWSLSDVASTYSLAILDNLDDL